MILVLQHRWVRSWIPLASSIASHYTMMGTIIHSRRCTIGSVCCKLTAETRGTWERRIMDGALGGPASYCLSLSRVWCLGGWAWSGFTLRNHSFGVCEVNAFFRTDSLFLLTLDIFYGLSRVDVFSVLRVPKSGQSMTSRMVHLILPRLKHNAHQHHSHNQHPSPHTHPRPKRSRSRKLHRRSTDRRARRSPPRPAPLPT